MLCPKLMPSKLGDTDKPFFKLGQSLNLPQTAVLSVRGLKRIPLLEEDAFQYWDSFDDLGESASLLLSVSVY